jgi:hypothetical protein
MTDKPMSYRHEKVRPYSIQLQTGEHYQIRRSFKPDYLCTLRVETDGFIEQLTIAGNLVLENIDAHYFEIDPLYAEKVPMRCFVDFPAAEIGNTIRVFTRGRIGAVILVGRII